MKIIFITRLIGGSAMLALAGMFAQASEEGAKAGFDLVRDGEARAAVVVAREATPTAEFAARELIDHVERATGVTLPLAREGAVPEEYAHRVYVGPTEAAARRGIDYGALPPDAYIIRTDGGDLYMGGDERAWFDPMALKPPKQMDRKSERNMTYGGTIRGVHAFLRRAAGVRWIWPGDLGTYVPHRETLRTEAWDVRESPVFGLRELRSGWGRRPDPSFAVLSKDEAEAHQKARELFFKRHGMGYSSYVTRLQGHFFKGWWRALGEEHPEWFAAGRDGKRPQWDGGEKSHMAMCVSAPGLHDYLVKHHAPPGVWTRGRHFGEQYIHLTQADTSSFCWGERCMSWDGPQPEPIRNTPGNRVVSDRYAKFWKLMHSRFAEDHPDIITNVYLYWQTFHAPTTDIQLNENIHAKFAPWRGKTMWMPMPEEDLEWMKEQWRGWRETGITMAYRPNFPHGGYVLPFADSRQTGEMIQWVAEHGSVGVEIDRINGFWSTRGPMLYVLARMIDEPGSDVERLRAEYFEAFGPAAEQIEAYFDYWEAHSRQIAREENWPQWGVRGMLGAPQHYGEEIFKPAARLLGEALNRAESSDNPRFAERVRFVLLGLENAHLTMQFLRALDEDGQVVRHDRKRFEAAQKAWRKMRQFRREYRDFPFMGFEYADVWEEKLLDDPEVLELSFEEARTEPSAPKQRPWAPWRIRPDPDNRGVQEGWFRGEAGGDGWRPVEVPAFWADALGEESDVEHAWYRTLFYMPEDWGGDDLRLTFDGVDEQAWVYVNGELVGEHTVDSEGVPPAVLWDQRFSVDVPAGLLRTNRPNHLVVRVKNEEDAAGIHGEVSGAVPLSEGENPLPVWESADKDGDGRN